MKRDDSLACAVHATASLPGAVKQLASRQLLLVLHLMHHQRPQLTPSPIPPPQRQATEVGAPIGGGGVAARGTAPKMFPRVALDLATTVERIQQNFCICDPSLPGAFRSVFNGQSQL